MSPTATPARVGAPARLRHRRNVQRLSAGQLADFREAIRRAQAIAPRDERGYQYQAGIHGLPLPISCKHDSRLFLAWHRAYLFRFEKRLQALVPGVTLPWWDWTHVGIPRAYRVKQTPDRRKNPLHSSPIQRVAAEASGWARTERDPGGPGAPPLPTPGAVRRLVQLDDFDDFQLQLEGIHGGVHMWVGGTMGEIPVAAYDPIFWAHHCMIDRIWRLWQLRHPRGGPGPALRRRALDPFPMTVEDTLDTNDLGYDYAAATRAAKGPGH
jgi:tyrosinase